MAAKISDEAVKAAYTVAKTVYQGKLTRAAGINDLGRRFLLNPSSAGDMIDNVAHMLKGEQYERTNNAFATKHFLRMIHEDFGLDALQNAMAAVDQHLDYYAALKSGSKLPAIRAIVEAFRQIVRTGLENDSHGGLPPEQRKAFIRQARSLAQAGAFDPTSVEDGRERIVAAIVRRQGQPAFRSTLLRAYEGRCAISDCDVQAALEAAHIIPYKGPQTDHTGNGLLLRSDLHTLFDLGLIVVDTSTMTVLLANDLEGSCYQEYAGTRVTLPKDRSKRPSLEALDEHRMKSPHFKDKARASHLAVD